MPRITESPTTIRRRFCLPSTSAPLKEIRTTLIRIVMPRGRPRVLVKRNSNRYVMVSSDYEPTAKEHLSISCLLCTAYV